MLSHGMVEPLAGHVEFQVELHTPQWSCAALLELDIRTE